VDHIQPKTDDNPWNNHYRRQAEKWAKMASTTWTRDYVGWPNGPWPLFHALQETRAFYDSLGCVGVADKYLSRNLGTDVHMWLSMRMAWDNKLRVTDLLNEFYPAYFGPAADDMRWIYEQFERHMLSSRDYGGTIMDAPGVYPPELVRAALARIAQARRKAAGDETILARIERDENCLKATRLWLRFCLAVARTTNRDRQEATSACRAYLAFVAGLDGTMTLGGMAPVIAKRMLEGLTSAGTYFAKSSSGRRWPGPFLYYDSLDQGGKSFHAKKRSGFDVGPYGLYLKPGAAGEIVYDVRLAEGLRFKEVSLPGPPGGCDLALRLALPKGGHNGIEVSLDQGRTWTTAFRDLEVRRDVVKHDLTRHVGGTNRFLLKFWVQNPTDEEILAIDSWTITGMAEPAKTP